MTNDGRFSEVKEISDGCVEVIMDKSGKETVSRMLRQMFKDRGDYVSEYGRHKHVDYPFSTMISDYLNKRENKTPVDKKGGWLSFSCKDISDDIFVTFERMFADYGHFSDFARVHEFVSVSIEDLCQYAQKLMYTNS